MRSVGAHCSPRSVLVYSGQRNSGVASTPHTLNVRVTSGLCFVPSVFCLEGIHTGNVAAGASSAVPCGVASHGGGRASGKRATALGEPKWAWGCWSWHGGQIRYLLLLRWPRFLIQTVPQRGSHSWAKWRPRTSSSVAFPAALLLLSPRVGLRVSLSSLTSRGLACLGSSALCAGDSGGHPKQGDAVGPSAPWSLFQGEPEQWVLFHGLPVHSAKQAVSASLPLA